MKFEMPASIPMSLQSGPFRVADALAAGLSERWLRGPGLWVPTRGVRSWSVPETLLDRARSFATGVVGDFAFSHITAAQLLGIPLSYSVEDDPRLHIIRPTTANRVRRDGIAGHRGLELREVVMVHGLPVVAAPDTWVDLGELVGPLKPVGLDDLVVAGDVIVNRLGSRRPLKAALERRCRPRGKVTLSHALIWVRVGSRSPMETRTRLMLVRAGLPEPGLNQHVISRDGLWLAWSDFVWKRKRVVGEFNGREFHSGAEQEAYDEARRLGLVDDDWTVIVVVRDDVFESAARDAKLREFAVALGVDPNGLDLIGAAPQFLAPRQFAPPRRPRAA